jgi:hypothetical protein
MMRVSAVALVTLVSAVAAAAQIPQAVSAQDKVEIQELVTRYALALGGCAAEEFADLFAPGAGYFASGIRGQVAGRERLIALVQSERHCIQTPAATPATAPAARPATAPTVVVEATSSGVYGIADLGAAGRYEDEYVKTPNGWRFAARSVLTPAERTAGLSAREMFAIRRLAGGGIDYADFYVAGQDGVRRFRSSGVAISVAAGTVSGRAYLKSGGYYDDVYEKTAQGAWRFTSRAFVADGQSAQTQRAAAQSEPHLAALSAPDLIEIQNLVSNYARYIDTCSNNGYDYADLFAPDGFFAPEQNGTIGRKFQGREQLAAVSGGGSNNCKNVGWIVQGVKHLYVNHIITPAAGSETGGSEAGTVATGSVEMLMIGLNGDPFRIRHEGIYEDTYVKTAQGWKFKSRIHHVPTGGTVGAAPAQQR